MEGTEATDTATETVTFDDDDSLDTVDVGDLDLLEDEDSPFPLSQNIHHPTYVKNEDGSSSHDGSDGEFGQNWSMELKFPGRFYIFCINSKAEIKYCYKPYILQCLINSTV